MPYFGSYFGVSAGAPTPPASIPVGGDFPAPSRLSAVYATDEDCLVIGGADFGIIVPRSNLVAAGSDGQFLAGYPWLLQSVSSAFDTQGVKAGMVVQVTGPSPPFKAAQFFAVSAVSSTGLTLRRPGMVDGQGVPPNPTPAAPLSGVTFSILTLYPQIEDTAYKLNEQFSVDPKLPGYRAPGDVYDQRVFRRLTVFRVFWLLYMSQNRDKRGDFADKISLYRGQYDDELATAVLRWGPSGTNQPATTRGSLRITR
jgi:hypothetical protein